MHGLVLLLAVGISHCSDTPLEEPIAKDPLSLEQTLVPQDASALGTRQYLVANIQPDPEDILVCFNELDTLFENAQNEEALLDMKKVFVNTIKDRKQLYHWCLYQLMSKLDEQLHQLDKDFRNKGQIFFDTMGKLWLISQALDEVTPEAPYFDFVRKRYVQISSEVFNRDVLILTPPFGHFPGKPLEIPKSQKEDPK